MAAPKGGRLTRALQWLWTRRSTGAAPSNQRLELAPPGRV